MAFAGGSFSLIISSDGAVYATGQENLLADIVDAPNDADTNTFLKVKGLENIVSIDGGGHFSLAIDDSGRLWGWGYSPFGELAKLGEEEFQMPETIYFPNRICAVSISTNGGFSLAIDETNRVWSWGQTDRENYLGRSAVQNVNPIIIPGLNNIVAIQAASQHSVALDAEGNVWTWGSNGDEQLGYPVESSSSSSSDNDDEFIAESFSKPQKVPTLSNIKKISADGRSTLALNDQGEVFAWGRNFSGEPTKVAGLSRICSISTGKQHQAVLDIEGQIFSWGENVFGACGFIDRGSYDEPTLLPMERKVIAIQCGSNHSMFLDESMSLYVCGLNQYQQLGTGDDKNRYTPTKVELTFVPAIFRATSTKSARIK